MKFHSRLHLVMLVIAGLVVTPMASATNGYFLIGYGAKARSMGGAGVAFPQDSLAAAANPAGMAHVGTRLDVGGEFFNPPRKVGTPDNNTGEFGFGLGTRKSGSNLFLIPSLGFAYKFNRKMSIGFSAIGNGSNTRFNEADNFFDVLANDRHTLGVQILQMQMLPTVAYRMSKNHTIGASLALAAQQFRAYGLGDFAITQFEFSSDPDNLTNRGNDYGYGVGVRLGWLGQFFDKRVSLGVNYASRVYMTKFDKYKGLFAEQGGFDIPENFAIGLAIKPTSKLTIAGDVMMILYSNVASVGNKHATTSIQDACSRPISATQAQCLTPGITPTPRSQALGADDGWGFGWKDSIAYKLGAAYEINNKLTVRAGVNYGKSVVRDDQLLFNLLAPAVVEWHATAGFTYSPTKHSDINFNYLHAFENAQECAAPDCVTLLTQTPGTYVAAELRINTVGLSWSYKF